MRSGIRRPLVREAAPRRQRHQQCGCANPVRAQRGDDAGIARPSSQARLDRRPTSGQCDGHRSTPAGGRTPGSGSPDRGGAARFVCVPGWCAWPVPPKAAPRTCWPSIPKHQLASQPSPRFAPHRRRSGARSRDGSDPRRATLPEVQRQRGSEQRRSTLLALHGRQNGPNASCPRSL